MNKRVVITGMGIVAPNAHGLGAYEEALRGGMSGIRFIPDLKNLNFSCQIGGIPQDFDTIRKRYFNHEKLLSINDNIGYASVSAIDAWRDAGLTVPEAEDDYVDWQSGVIVGSVRSGMDTIATQLLPMVKEGKVRRMGSRVVEQVMSSGTSACIAGILALGNQVTSNSSTGSEALIEGMWRIRMGLAKRMLTGGSEGSSPYIWGGFDAMRVMCHKFNEEPQKGSRPMSASACGFVPGSGGAVLILEELETALGRGARIYAEVLGGAVNCCGLRMGGSITASNPEGIQRCIRMAVADAGIEPGEIDAINGCLTATFSDPMEVSNWSKALRLLPSNFPYINSTKSLVGHCLGAAGAVECVAVALQLYKGFIHPSVNCKDIHPAIADFAHKVPQSCIDIPGLRTIAKAGFGFGDLNSCIIFRKWEE
ncbi:MAG: beta-ketoacyl-[acyl-carrier-protein] synthase family protein [Smithellaceae bacterium]